MQNLVKLKKISEECGVFGVSQSKADVAFAIYDALLGLQHRGQEAAGVAVIKDNDIVCQRGLGLLPDIYNKGDMTALPNSQIGIGHVNASSNLTNKSQAQPSLTEYLTGRVSVALNCVITNAESIKEELTKQGLRFDNYTSSAEIFGGLVAFYATKTDIVSGFIKACQQLQGAFCVVALTSCGRLLAARDGNGFRPLVLGKSRDGIAVSSESCGLDSAGFEFDRDVLPGEVLVIKDGKLVQSSKELKPTIKGGGLCIFEYVYLARPDSLIDGLGVSESRNNMGRTLAKEHPASMADIVCGVPDSGLEAAIGYAEQSGLPLVTGFVKNRYVGRSFIYPTQLEREHIVQVKLNPIRRNVKGKSIVLVDDSIVRGTTGYKMVKALKDAGAKQVHLRLSSPPFKHQCFYGTDIDKPQDLIANRVASIDDIAKQLGADSIGYISMQGLTEACNKSQLAFCHKCFTGN